VITFGASTLVIHVPFLQHLSFRTKKEISAKAENWLDIVVSD
jgi:hypothetical protein